MLRVAGGPPITTASEFVIQSERGVRRSGQPAVDSPGGSA